jgi:hypothetical protein
VKKQIGYCHRASCHTSFDLARMIDIIGYPPELAGYVPMMYVDTPPPMPVALPSNAVSIEKQDSDMLQALQHRGVQWDMIQKFSIHSNKTHIIVPIYEDGVLVQYNSRRINRKVHPHMWFSALGDGVKRYDYAKGHPITNYFLGWSECKLWERLVLVENTFVSMWLRDLGCTTNFGSHLSDTQINKIVHSTVKHVTILWDEGAKTQKAERALKKVGVPCKVVTIAGQPDDYPKETIEELIK